MKSHFHLDVNAPDGGLLCADTCSALPASGEVHLLTDVTVVPPVRGPVVPVSAVTTAADGTASVVVVRPDGDEARPVQIVTSVDGLAVVEGVEVGDVFRVFGAEPTE